MSLPVLPNPYTLAQALTTREAEDIRQQILADMATEGVDVVGFDPMGVAVALTAIHAKAQNFADVMRASITMGGFMQYAAQISDDWCDAIAAGWFDETRIAAVAAVNSWPVSCVSTAGPYTIGPGSGELVAVADDGTLFASSNPTAVIIPSGGSASMQFTCRTPGAAGNQVGGAVTRFVAAKPGLSVTNVGGTVVTPGRDKETNRELARRCFGKWGVLSAGYTRAAFDYLIPFYAPTLTRWYVDDANPSGPGSVNVWLANAAGPATTAEVAAVNTGLNARDRKPLGTSLVEAFAAVARTVVVSGTLYGDGTNGNLLGDATDALATLQANFPLGGLFELDLLIAVLLGARFDAYALPGFLGVVQPTRRQTPLVLTAPTGDVQFAVNEVLAINASGLAVSQ